jgi:hypothetical protein
MYLVVYTHIRTGITGPTFSKQVSNRRVTVDNIFSLIILKPLADCRQSKLYVPLPYPPPQCAPLRCFYRLIVMAANISGGMEFYKENVGMDSIYIFIIIESARVWFVVIVSDFFN